VGNFPSLSTPPAVKAFSDFVELAEKKEREGKKLYIDVSW